MIRITIPRFTKFQLAVHVAAWLPLIWLVWAATQSQLSINPIQDLEQRTGKIAMILLVLSLACTPANTVFGFTQAVRVRRALGLYAFMYAAIHLAIFVGVDYGFDLRLLKLEFTEKRYIIAGLAAFLVLVPLAITSTKGWQRRLRKRWKSLHTWVYLAGILVIVHYIWLTKNHRGEPLVWGAIVIILLALRIPKVRRTIVDWRGRLTGRSASRGVGAGQGAGGNARG